MATHVALVNRTTVVDDSDVEALAQALTDQCGHLAAAGYPVHAEVGVHGARSVPRDAWQLILVDDSDVPGALGYHDRTVDGRPVAFAFARTVMDAGLEWTVTASHELVETLVDANALLGVDLGRDDNGAHWWVAWETADPVEADADGYTITTVTEAGERAVLVSDFVTPAWFVDGSPGPFDWCRRLDTPLTLRPGGYAAVQINGEWTQVVAQKASPDGRSRAEWSHRIDRRGPVAMRRWPVDEDLLLRVRST